MPAVQIVGGMGERIVDIIIENLKRSHRERRVFSKKNVRNEVQSEKGERKLSDAGKNLQFNPQFKRRGSRQPLQGKPKTPEINIKPAHPHSYPGRKIKVTSQRKPFP